MPVSSITRGYISSRTMSRASSLIAAGPTCFSITLKGAFPGRKPGILTRWAILRAAFWRALSNVCFSTSTVKRIWWSANASWLIFKLYDSLKENEPADYSIARFCQYQRNINILERRGDERLNTGDWRWVVKAGD